jgi:hypothetical protein
MGAGVIYIYIYIYIYIPSFMKIGSGIRKFLGWGTKTA